MKIKYITLAALMTGSTAAAQDMSDFGFSAGVSTLGAVVEGTYAINDRLEARGMIVGGLNYSGTETFEDDNGDEYSVDADAQLGGVGLIADYYMMGGWRLSGGLFFSTTELSGTFTGPETFEGDIGFTKDVAPMLATGYRYEFRNGVTMATELGAIFSGMEVSTTSTDADVLAEVADLNDELEVLKAVPYLSLTVGYQF